MNTKNLTLNILDFVNELTFIQSYYKNLLAYCIEYELRYDGKIAVEIIKFNERIDELLIKPDEILNNEDIKFLIKIAEGRTFLVLNELSKEYNRQNTHEILKIPRYKMYHVLERHGY
ncbi:MAG: hypothetical protein BZ135_01565 [Methanosphaera sp. rholeuAM6]|nr:MAG: hypothetical protein BZ135_01565 [Methanosphaera sp. rholeuAM6]